MLFAVALSSLRKRPVCCMNVNMWEEEVEEEKNVKKARNNKLCQKCLQVTKKICVWNKKEFLGLRTKKKLLHRIFRCKSCLSNLFLFCGDSFSEERKLILWLTGLWKIFTLIFKSTFMISFLLITFLFTTRISHWKFLS